MTRCECYECGIVKKGCKPIKELVGSWKETENEFLIWKPETTAKEEFIGKMVCRSCANFAKSMNNFYIT